MGIPLKHPQFFMSGKEDLFSHLITPSVIHQKPKSPIRYVMQGQSASYILPSGTPPYPDESATAAFKYGDWHFFLKREIEEEDS